MYKNVLVISDNLYLCKRIEEVLKLKLRSLGYPLTTDELSGFEKATTTAKSFVSCAIGKFNS